MKSRASAESALVLIETPGPGEAGTSGNPRCSARAGTASGGEWRTGTPYIEVPYLPQIQSVRASVAEPVHPTSYWELRRGALADPALK